MVKPAKAEREFFAFTGGWIMRQASRCWLNGSRKVPTVIPAKFSAMELVDSANPVGASLVFTIVKVKVSLIAVEEPSVAVTLTLISPTLSFNGVPVKLRVEALKLNQEGKDEPFASVAV